MLLLEHYWRLFSPLPFGDYVYHVIVPVGQEYCNWPGYQRRLMSTVTRLFGIQS